MADETETVVADAAPPPPFWVGLCTWLAVALVALIALQIFGILGQTSGLKATGLTYSDKLGYAFLQNLDQAPVGIELLIASLLVLTPVIARQPTNQAQDRAAQFVLVGAAVLAVVVMIGGVIGVPARIHIVHKLPAPQNKVTPVIKWVLVTFVIRNVATAAVALVAAIGGVRVRFAPRRVAVASDES